MKKNLGILVLVALLSVACGRKQAPEVKTVAIAGTPKVKEIAPENLTKAELSIDGMTCAVGCAATIQKNLAKMEGVKFAKVDFGRKLAMVEYDETQLGVEDLKKTVAKTGKMYKVTDSKDVESFSGE